MAKSKNLASTNTGKPWKQLEKLVSQIEESYCDKAVVKSHDYINDVFSGNPIQVDVSIRYKIGSVDALMIIECRDRGRKQEVNWIRELAGRKKDCGASVLIGVSTQGFTKEAIRKAKFDGIILRKLGKIDASKILSEKWELIKRNYKITSAELTFYDTPQDVANDIQEELVGKYKSDILNVDLLIFDKHQKSYKLVDIFHNEMYKKRDELDVIEVPKREVSKTIGLDMTFPDADVYVECSLGKVFIQKYRAEFFFYEDPAEPLSPYSSYIYSDEGLNPIVEVTELRSAAHGGNYEIFTVHKDVKTNSKILKYGIDGEPMSFHPEK